MVTARIRLAAAQAADQPTFRGGSPARLEAAGLCGAAARCGAAWRAVDNMEPRTMSRCPDGNHTLQLSCRLGRFLFVIVAFGFAMNDRASVELSTAKGSVLDDGLVSLVQWRLRDPAWSPSFADLLEDVRTCIDPAAEPGMVLAALRDALKADDGLAARARTLAIQAQSLMAGREARNNPPARTPPATSALRRLAEMRPVILGG